MNIPSPSFFRRYHFLQYCASDFLSSKINFYVCEKNLKFISSFFFCCLCCVVLISGIRASSVLYSLLSFASLLFFFFVCSIIWSSLSY